MDPGPCETSSVVDWEVPQLQVAPNPASDRVQSTWMESPPVLLRVIGFDGQVVWSYHTPRRRPIECARIGARHVHR